MRVSLVSSKPILAKDVVAVIRKLGFKPAKDKDAHVMVFDNWDDGFRFVQRELIKKAFDKLRLLQDGFDRKSDKHVAWFYTKDEVGVVVEVKELRDKTTRCSIWVS